jgi:hypothetical protein
MRTFIHIPFTLAVLLAFVAPSSAQTIGYAEAADRLGLACGADIQKYCKNVNLGNGRINSCLEQNQANVSLQCKLTRAEVFQLLQKRAVAQAVVRKVCDTDIRRLCAGVVQDDGYLLECGLKAWRALSDKCQQAITDAGWR